MTYLDYNASGPLRKEARAAIARVGARAGNPSSLHRLGQQARREVDDAVAAIRQLVGASRAEVIFTSSGTEADNLAVAGIARARRVELPSRKTVVIGATEHPAVLHAAQRLQSEGFQIHHLPVGNDGQPSFEDEILEGDRIAVIALMAANNETGIVTRVDDWIGPKCLEKAIPLHVDAVQAAGKFPLEFDRGPFVSSMALSAHKFGGPRGIGALVLRTGVSPQPLWFGGGQQDGLRSGTLPTALIVGMAAAAQAANHELPLTAMESWRDRFEEEILLTGKVEVLGRNTQRLPNTSALILSGIRSWEAVQRLNEAGIQVSGGAACHAGQEKPSSVLLAMGIDEERAKNAIRVSFGWTTTESDVVSSAAQIRHLLAA